MMLIHQIVLEISKITGPWDIGHTDLEVLWGHSEYYEVTRSVILNQYPKYDVNPWNNVSDIK